MVRRAGLFVLAAGLVVSTCPADASPREPSRSITVSTADLNLRTVAGAQLAMLRIREAASRVCGGELDLSDRGRRARYRACVDGAANRAALALVAARGEPAPDILVLAGASP